MTTPAGRPAVLRGDVRRVLVSACAVATLVGCAGSPPPSLTPESAAAQIRLSASASTPKFVATAAVADFGIEDGVRLVKVRIVDQMQIDVRVESAIDVVFDEPPRLCLVGPDAAPDDAGLELPCWGSPDLGAVIAQRLSRSPGGLPMLAAARPIAVSVTLNRDDQRCDYPAGHWTLELAARPMIGGEAPDRDLYAPPASFAVMLVASEPPLPYLKTDRTHYCGLATRVFQEQGEPQTVAP